MSRLQVYIGILILLAAAGSVWAFNQGPISSSQWLPFTVLTGLAILSQAFRAGSPGKLSLYVDNLFQFAAILLLHPFLLVPLVVIPQLVETVYERVTRRPHPRAWHDQSFNIAMYILIGFAALWAGSLIAGARLNPTVYSGRMIAAILLAAPVHIGANTLLVALSLVLDGERELGEMGVFDWGVWLTDFILLMMGYMAAILWTINPWLIFLAVSPLLILYRAHQVPQLEQAAQTDGKTGLLNAQWFMERFNEEFEQVQRRSQPLSVLMADLDLLRNINNTYGHLAGDAVLAGVGKIIQETVRDSDIAGRFGGEEFAIVLPNVDQSGAAAIAERLCRAVEQAEFPIDAHPTPIHATMSIGVASYPQDGGTVKELVHRADMAVYQAKLNGRNCVVCSPNVPDAFPLQASATLEKHFTP
jgi:diguanylate cyclase (GGDEF)-like protein